MMNGFVGGGGRGGIVAAMILALAVVAAGVLVGRGIEGFRSADRYVTVKGVAERNVRADLAIWPLQLVVTDYDLRRAQTRMNANVAQTMRFLRDNGIDTSAVSLQGLRVTDVQANPYQPPRPGNRFIIQQTVIVRDSLPDRIARASSRVGDLVDAGVVLSSGTDYGPGGPVYLFKGLNALKPEMIAEATAEARKAAEQFAHDSKSRLGGIRTANQGVFVILPRDEVPGFSEQNQPDKIVRVVTTVEFRLVD